MQHSPACWQGCPFVLQRVSQVPPGHEPEQHSASPPQGEPPGLHIVPAPHSPPLHCPEQHWPGAEHAVPSGPHAVPQMAFVQAPAQHSLGAEHGSPLFLHVGAVHRSSTHSPEQHDVPNSQMDPASRQDATHCPLWQAPEQHSAGDAQAPLALHPVPVDPTTGPAVVAPPDPPPPKDTCGSLLHAPKAERSASEPTAAQGRKDDMEAEVTMQPTQVKPATRV